MTRKLFAVLTAEMLTIFAAGVSAQQATDSLNTAPAGAPTINQSLEMRINRPIAFAATVLEALDIENMDATASVVDKSGLLELARYQGHAAALHAQHLREKFLGQRQRVAAQQVACL